MIGSSNWDYVDLNSGISGYAIQTLLQLYDGDFEKVKSLIVFTPQEYIRVLKMIKHEKALLWDDAGYWLYAQDFNVPFVKQAVKYINVARTKLSALILNTPSISMLVKKIRTMDSIVVKIVKANRDGYDRMRLAKGYRNAMHPTGRKYVTQIFEDSFSKYMPTDFYLWYKPIRDYYADIGLDISYLLMKVVEGKYIYRENKLESGHWLPSYRFGNRFLGKVFPVFFRLKKANLGLFLVTILVTKVPKNRYLSLFVLERDNFYRVFVNT